MNFIFSILLFTAHCSLSSHLYAMDSITKKRLLSDFNELNKNYGGLEEVPLEMSIINKSKPTLSKPNMFMRYADIPLFTETKLQVPSNLHPTAQLHANLVSFPDDNQKYIAMMAPNFYGKSILFQYLLAFNSKQIVMLTDLNENGDKKADDYYSDKTIGDPKKGGFIIRELSLTESIPQKKGSPFFKHYHFEKWSDFAQEISLFPIDNFISLIKTVAEDNIMLSTDLTDPPTLTVHCSAGIGRTGVFIISMYAYKLLKKGDFSKFNDIFDFLKFSVGNLRTQRAFAIKIDDEYLLLYSIITKMLSIFRDTPRVDETCGEINNLNPGKRNRPEENINGMLEEITKSPKLAEESPTL